MNTPNTKITSVFGGTILHKYAKNEEWSMLLAAATPDKLRVLNDYGRTPLHYAVELGAPEELILELIRLAPFQVRVRDSAGETPLHLGCQFGISLLSVYAILHADNDTNAARGQPAVWALRNNDRQTPLETLEMPNKAAKLVKNSATKAVKAFEKVKQAAQRRRWMAPLLRRYGDDQDLLSEQHVAALLPQQEEQEGVGEQQPPKEDFLTLWRFHREQAESVKKALEDLNVFYDD